MGRVSSDKTASFDLCKSMVSLFQIKPMENRVLNDLTISYLSVTRDDVLVNVQ